MGPTIIVPGTQYRNAPTDRMSTYTNIKGLLTNAIISHHRAFCFHTKLHSLLVCLSVFSIGRRVSVVSGLSARNPIHVRPHPDGRDSSLRVSAWQSSGRAAPTTFRRRETDQAAPRLQPVSTLSHRIPICIRKLAYKRLDTRDQVFANRLIHFRIDLCNIGLGWLG